MSEDQKPAVTPAESVEQPEGTDTAEKAVNPVKARLETKQAPVDTWECPEKVGTNSLRLPWPTDPLGALQPLKEGAIKSVGRINGDKVKYEKFRQTMRVILKYAEEKTELAVEKRKVAKTNSISASKRVAQRQKAAAEEKVAGLQKQIDAINSSYGLKEEASE